MEENDESARIVEDLAYVSMVDRKADAFNAVDPVFAIMAG
jgi:hypothetical protein